MSSFKSFRYDIFHFRSCLYYQFNVAPLSNQLNFSQYQRYDEIRGQQLTDLAALIRDSDLTWYEKKGNGPISVEQVINRSISISKMELRDEFDKIYHSAEKEFVHITSGSSGLPLKVIASHVSEAHRAAQRLRFYGWWGIEPWDKSILIWGKLSAGQEEAASPARKLKNWIVPPKELFVNVFDLNSASISGIYKQCREKKAAYIRGYTSGIYHFCSLLRAHNFDGKKLGLRLAIVTSEILLEEHRHLIKEVLGCPVANEYGAAEFGLFACECPEGGMHICEELNLLQTHPDGRLLVTDLHNTCTPLLNYDIGDRIVIGDKPCSCGRGLRVIEEILGREGDLVKRPNGEYASQYVFYYAAKEIAALGFSGAISQYKVIQRGWHFTVFLVKGPKYTRAAVDLFVERIKENIGKEISVHLEFVKEVPRETSGKIRFFQRMDS